MRNLLCLLLLFPVSLSARTYYQKSCSGYVDLYFTLRDSTKEIDFFTNDSSYTFYKSTTLRLKYSAGTYKTWMHTVYPNSANIDTIYLIVNNPPVITIDSIPDFHSTDPPFDLSDYGHPRGGKWSCYKNPSAFVNNQFIISRIKDTVVYLRYTYTDPQTYCTSTDSVRIRIIGNQTGIKITNYDLTNVFPNPFKAFLNISVMETDQVNIRILDMSGKLVYCKSFAGQGRNFRISGLNDLCPGIYILNMSSNSGERNIKIFKSIY